MSVLPDGQEIAFAEYLDWNNSPNNEYVYVVPPRAGAHGQKLAGPDAWNPNWSMDGRWIAFVKRQHTIKVMNADGTGVRTVVRLKVTVGSFDW